MLATIRLFKAVPVPDRDARPSGAGDARAIETVGRGFLLAPAVLAAYPDPAPVIALVDQLYGRDPEQLNAAFHKSFATVRDAPLRRLVAQQIVHYLSTYGMEALGLHDADAVFIPGERLDAPQLAEGVRLVVIRGLTPADLKRELLALLATGAALGEREVAAALEVAALVGLDADEVAGVRNREVRAGLYAHLGLVPRDPVEFLRHVVFRATGRALLIKNAAALGGIRGGDLSLAVADFRAYQRLFGLARLAEVFYRFKPIFLAFRAHPSLRMTVNAIRRLAPTHHRPLPPDRLNGVAADLARRGADALADLPGLLAGASTLRKVRLAQALHFRAHFAESVVYTVRNGRAWAAPFGYPARREARLARDLVLASIAEDLAPRVAGRRVFIPAAVRYGLPATGKQFTGVLPSGTAVAADEDMVVGIHWEDQAGTRIDLDLSLVGVDGKIGWDGRYRDAARGIYFSGDVTSAPPPRGASELFHLGAGVTGTWLLFVNYFNHDEAVPAPCRVFVASARREEIGRDYLIDPSRILASGETVVSGKQKLLGIVVAGGAGARFHFAEADLGRGISAGLTAHAERVRRYLAARAADPLALNDLLVAAGAVVVGSAAEADLDLAPEALDAATILGLLAPAPA